MKEERKERRWVITCRCGMKKGRKEGIHVQYRDVLAKGRSHKQWCLLVQGNNGWVITCRCGMKEGRNEGRKEGKKVGNYL